MRITFAFDEDPIYVAEEDHLWEVAPLGSLKRFVYLKRLEIAGPFLMHGWPVDSNVQLKDVLPSSLHNLLITSMAESTANHLYAFAFALPDFKDQGFSHLNHIFDLSQHGRLGLYLGENLEEFVAVLQDVGVNFRKEKAIRSTLVLILPPMIIRGGINARERHA
ncbi:uncharacterized protein BDZ99DRAFT_522976 [Mytilinidion resinicola]|uniref:Uncharacterized protein n=1 Tax=Mytilinidion resinicola TaxID=574789 RepID=A0A6A6YHI5_9PEZI|nr:uncharacterized protein BDZ99DRAFT_522976 [Mytilinidion resinicola]KAF2807357.1 hypothetical protein BDZ99DRAFT_522976 [Mytilinidion resinicola]